jgi:protoporphyrinogen oxidase
MSQRASSTGAVVILGGGLAGLSALWHLQEAGYDNSFLFERESRVGGLARSENVNGFTFDRTGHLLHFKSDAIQKLVTHLLRDNLHFLQRDSWVFSKGVYSRYPFQTNLFGLPPDVIRECIEGFMSARSQSHTRGEGSTNPSVWPSFQDWIDDRLGSGFAKHFMIPYNQKLWTVPASELICDWMGRFVPDTSLEQILEGAHSDRPSNAGYNARFAYPLRGGIEALPRAISKRLRNIETGIEAVSIDTKEKTVRFSDGRTIGYSFLVSSIPLPGLVDLIKDTPSCVRESARKLRFTSVYNLNLGIHRRPGNRHWVYVPEPEYVFYRVGFSHNFSPHQAPPNCGSLYVEVAYSDWKPIDKPQIVTRIKQDLLKAGILQRQDEVLAELGLDIPCAYVLYDHNYRHNSDIVKRYTQACGIRTIGRYGSWEYSGMEDAIRQGNETAREIMGIPAEPIC